MGNGGPSARATALALLAAVVRRRRPLDDAWAAALRPGGPLDRLEARDRAFARLLVTTTLRRLGQIDAAIDRCLERPRLAARVRDVIRLGTAQLLFLGTPAHAAVDATVRLAPGDAALKGLVNAVLRRLARHGAAWLADQDAARLNVPDWLWRSWCGSYGEATARAIAGIHLAEPPLDLSLKQPGEKATARWAQRLDARMLPTGSLRRAGGGRIEDIEGYCEGAWWVQDAAAALPARLFDQPLGGLTARTVLDLCAAPGGKTAQLAAAGARVIALDRSTLRLRRLGENLSRLGLEARCIAADATTWRRPPDEPAVDAILLDAPCSATGTMRRHPDVAYTKRPADLARLADLQARLLDAALGHLRPGGILVYAACSLEPAEGRDQIAALLAAHGDLQRVPVEPAEVAGQSQFVTTDGDLQTLPCHFAEAGGMDGFYAARLRRRA